MKLFSVQYKDADPLDTILRAEKILNYMNIVVEIVSLLNSLEGLHSVSIREKDNNYIRVNGKGLSYEMAMASALGEFFERMQNNYLGIKYHKSINKLNSYSFIKQNTRITYEKALKNLNSIYVEGYSFDGYLSVYSKCKLVNAYKFKEITSNKEIEIPIEFLDFFIASNGMCAGNTYEEAMVQGISEIIERYVCREIMNNKIVPRVIIIDRINELLQNVISNIEEKGIKLVFLDCSMGIKLPAVGMIAINKKSAKYFVKFSSNPILDIAIERLLTEFMQGQHISFLKGFSDISSNVINPTINKKSIFENSFLSREMCKYSELSHFYNGKDTSNLELLNFLIELLKSKGYKIFLKDSTYTDFNSLRIFIPYMSEIYNDKDWEIYRAIEELRNNIFDSIMFNRTSCYDFIRDNIHLLNERNIFNILLIPIENDRYMYDIDMYMAVLAERRGELVNAIDYLESLLVNQENNMSYNEIMLIKCKITILKMKEENYCIEDRLKILELFYSKCTIKKAEELLFDSYITHEFNRLNCKECSKCIFRQNCYIKNIINFYEKINNKMYYE